jgi:hypothetical protein
MAGLACATFDVIDGAAEAIATVSVSAIAGDSLLVWAATTPTLIANNGIERASVLKPLLTAGRGFGPSLSASSNHSGFFMDSMVCTFR